MSADPSRWSELKNAITDTLASEKQTLSRLKSRKAEADRILEQIASEVNLSGIQMASIGNRLLLADTTLESLQKAQQDHQGAMGNLEQRLGQLSQLTQALSLNLLQTDEQIGFNEKQRTELRALDAAAPEKRLVTSQLDELVGLLKQKKELIGALERSYEKQVRHLKETLEQGAVVTRKIEERLEELRRTLLFQRVIHPLKVVNEEWIQSELQVLMQFASRMADRNGWKDLAVRAWRDGGFLTVTYLILFLVWVRLLFRLRRFFKSRLSAMKTPDFTWRLLATEMLFGNIVWIGLIVVLFAALHIGALNALRPLIEPAMHLAVVLLFFKWTLHYLRHPLFREPASPFAGIVPQLVFMGRLTRVFALVLVAENALLGSGSVLALFTRLLFEMFLLGSLVLLSKKLRNQRLYGERIDAVRRAAGIAIGYTATGGALVSELAGFGYFAAYWLLSWGVSIVVAIWARVGYRSLKEWDQPLDSAAPAASGEGGRASAHPVRWMVFRLSWLVWSVFFLLLFLITWGGVRAVLKGLTLALTYPVHMGSITLSLIGVINMLLILFFTHLGAKLWQHVLQNRILDNSGLEKGLKNSIARINLYLVWAAGVVVALHAFGLNTATMAVVFGALSVGLGFGLQNIFNNFVSGIILLFERPIQVGDVVEVAGTWGEVQKINFRSTVVQTYDNASMIIPNSEFISARVVNWSFNGKLVRRKIAIGVAYGSDVERVRQTLIEIADTTEGVYKYPEPDVIFYDHGESDLKFWLRFYTSVDTIYSTETQIRFSIERLFRERGIQVPFPQRDIHIHHTFPKKDPAENESDA